MRVVCIEDKDQIFTELPTVKKGNIYTVFDHRTTQGGTARGYTFIPGTYYFLVECGNVAMYHESMFVTINEDQQDETTFERNLQKEKV